MLRLSAAVALAFPAGALARTELDLSGSWQVQNVAELTYPPTNAWQATTVPGYLQGWQYERAWFRTDLVLPGSMSGSRLKLQFGGVKFSAEVWLNGVLVGSHLNGYEPFEFDITTAALVGQTNEFVVGVTDWTGLFSEYVDFSTMQEGDNPRRHPEDVILAPIGGRYDLYGIWQPVKVLSVPAISIADVFVMPSTRDKQLALRLTLRNDGMSQQTVTVINEVFEGATPAFTMATQQVVLAAGEIREVDLSASWTNAHWWSHVDPHLYTLRTTIDSASGTDAVDTRFGFREFWTEGGTCYLNGIPIHLLAASSWPPSTLQGTNEIRKLLLDVKNGNNVCIRFHTQPWDTAYYDVADEIGLLVVEEFAVWCDPRAYRLGDTAFWANYAAHLSEAVRRDRNHPSIVLWSLENEILHCGGGDLYAGTEAELATLGQLVKNIDPTRPITYEADLDPGGEADVLGLHYPYEFPDHHVWPNSAYWMDQTIPIDWIAGGQWLWDRLKPLYIGEFLWVPGTAAGDFTILFGDDAYSDPYYYRNRSKGLIWKMQIEAYRAYGVNGICPWTLFEDIVVQWGDFDLYPESNHLYQVQKAAYEPAAIFSEEYNSRFFAGESGQRTMHVYNDRFVPADFTLRWRAGAGATHSQSFALPPAGQWTNTLSFDVPPVKGDFALEFVLEDGGSPLFTNTVLYSALPRTTLSVPPGVTVAVYDPPGTTKGVFDDSGVSYVTVTNLDTATYSAFDLLVIGRDALTAEPVPAVGFGTTGHQWQDFGEAGGWVLVLEQTNYPSWMPGGMQIADYDASFAFPSADHPVTADLTPADLRWWADDHRLVRSALESPHRGNVRNMAGIGSRSGMEYSAAVELPIGDGGIICSQLLLIERMHTEPLAGILLQRLIDYCAAGTEHPVYRPIGLLSTPTSEAAARLAAMGLLAKDVAGRLSDCDPADIPVLLIAGDAPAWQEAAANLSALTNYVGQGGRLLLHRPTDAFLLATQASLFPGLDYTQQSQGLVLRREITNATFHVANHDLYWIAEPGAWETPEILATNIAQRYYRKTFTLTAYDTIEVEDMPVQTSGGATTGGWLLWSNGRVAQDIEILDAGTHLFNVLASGTPAFGGWPEMHLEFDGVTMDSVSVPTDQPLHYTLSADLGAGTHELAISYNNDAYNPPDEDRNLFLDHIEWGRDDEDNPASLLTRPGAVAQHEIGSGLVILDEITWDTEAQNAKKAERYASRMLTDLGAAMRQSTSLGIEAEAMSNMNVSAYAVTDGIARLNSNGRIETIVNVTASGDYVFEITAGGTEAAGVLPEIGITLNGMTLTTFFLESQTMAQYTVTVSLPAGIHAIGLVFLNDLYAPPEDRNASIDAFTITPKESLRIAGLDVDPLGASATVHWNSAPGSSYEVQVNPDLMTGEWQAVTTVTCSTIYVSWEDTVLPLSEPPAGPETPQRYYRVQNGDP